MIGTNVKRIIIRANVPVTTLKTAESLSRQGFRKRPRRRNRQGRSGGLLIGGSSSSQAKLGNERLSTESPTASPNQQSPISNQQSFGRKSVCHPRGRRNRE